jgi:hypothetical protein
MFEQIHPAMKTMLAMPVTRAFSPPPSRNPSIAGAQIMAMAPNTRLSTELSLLVGNDEKNNDNVSGFCGSGKGHVQELPKTNYRQFRERPSSRKPLNSSSPPPCPRAKLLQQECSQPFYKGFLRPSFAS